MCATASAYASPLCRPLALAPGCALSQLSRRLPHQRLTWHIEWAFGDVCPRPVSRVPETAPLRYVLF